MRSLKNFKAEPPHQHVLYHMTFLLMEKAWSKEELAACLEGKCSEGDGGGVVQQTCMMGRQMDRLMTDRWVNG